MGKYILNDIEKPEILISIAGKHDVKISEVIKGDFFTQVIVYCKYDSQIFRLGHDYYKILKTV